MTSIALATHDTFSSLESIALEMAILALAPSSLPAQAEAPRQDYRERNGASHDGYSDRLDAPLARSVANGRGGPILDKGGRPLQPFTLLDSRDRLRQGVFRPGHNLPTMTIDEYLDEERRRGGIIDGGGEESARPAVPDEDDVDKADAETMKVRYGAASLQHQLTRPSTPGTRVGRLYREQPARIGQYYEHGMTSWRCVA